MVVAVTGMMIMVAMEGMVKRKVVVVIMARTVVEVILNAMAHFLPDLGPWTKYHW